MRSASSFWIVTIIECGTCRASSRFESTGVAMLYGRLATSLSRRPGAAAKLLADRVHHAVVEVVLVPQRVELQHRHVRQVDQLLAGQLEQMGVDFDRDDRRRLRRPSSP